MIEPLKRDIEDLKTDRDNRNAALNVETLSGNLRTMMKNIVNWNQD